jgi:carbon storage regulator
MLVLSRQANERIIIGEDVEIVVVEVRGKRVRLGIKAPGNVPIIREELKAANNDVDELGIQQLETGVAEK